MEFSTRMDMHCHSSASREPVTPWLRALGVAECYSEPELVYEQARARGMGLVTITDHDTVSGVVSLAERGFEGVVIGEEVTVRFPEDRCRLHVLVWGLTTDQHEEIGALGLRDDVYRFGDWLFTHNLAHAWAHPFYSQNGKLTQWHIERCVLLFRAWEVLNGAHSAEQGAAVERYLAGLTAGKVQALQERHGLRALWMRAWQKPTTGGSDDHALLNVGRTWTEVRHGQRAIGGTEFLRHAMAGHGAVGGQTGSASLLAHQAMAVCASHYAREYSGEGGETVRRVSAGVARLAGVVGATVREPGRSGAASAGRVFEEVGAALRGVLERHPGIAADLLGAGGAGGMDGPAFSRHDEMAAFVDDVAGALSGACASGLVRAVKATDHRGAVESLLAGVLALAAQLPTVLSMFLQHKDRGLLVRMDEGACLRGGPEGSGGRALRVCVFTDTLREVNGVSRFLGDVLARSDGSGGELRVITSARGSGDARDGVVNFEPVFAEELPGYVAVEAVLPPVLKMLRFADSWRPDVVHVSTPGPVGVVGLIAAAMLRVPVVGVYHTDFAAYVDRIFDDSSLTAACRWWERAFYSRLDRVLARSEASGRALLEMGVEGSRALVLPAGTDLGRFGAHRRDPSVWARIEKESAAFAGLSRQSAKVLFVGRLSVEKNTAMLARVWVRVAERCVRTGTPADLVVVGDGPARAELEAALRGLHAHFVGWRHGEELAAIYATGGLLVFPSVTDTLGQAVMEAQASGVAAVVSDRGGPREIVRHGVSGLVLAVDGAGAEAVWGEAVWGLIADAGLRASMGESAAAGMRERGVDRTVARFWEVHGEAHRERLRRLGAGAVCGSEDGSVEAAGPAEAFDRAARVG